LEQTPESLKKCNKQQGTIRKEKKKQQSSLLQITFFSTLGSNNMIAPTGFKSRQLDFLHAQVSHPVTDISKQFSISICSLEICFSIRYHRGCSWKLMRLFYHG